MLNGFVMACRVLRPFYLNSGAGSLAHQTR